MLADTGIWVVDTDPFINVAHLRRLHYDLMQGVALSRQVPISYGLGLFKREDGISNARQTLSELHHTDPRAQKYSELVRLTDHLGVLERKAILYDFIGMAFGTYSGGWTVSIRTEGENYSDKNDEHKCVNTLDSKHFLNVMQFVGNLPFSEVGRVIVFVNYPGGQTPIHMDGTLYQPHTNDFLWMRTSTDKRFFVYDPDKDEKHYVQGYTAFFNEQDFHGTDISKGTTFSLRVDGRFRPEFKKAIGINLLKSYI